MTASISRDMELATTSSCLSIDSAALRRANQLFRVQGWAQLEACIDSDDIGVFLGVLEDPSVHRVLEDDRAALRSIYGFQGQAGFRRWLARQRWLRVLLEDLLGPEVYVYQTKINLKNRLATSVWPYHRDYSFWHAFDGVPDCRMVNLAIFLDEVTADCGPLKMLSHSHQKFLARETQDPQTDYTLQASAGADLAFAFSEEEMRAMRDEFTECSIEGPKGSVLLFHPQIVHGSSASSQDSSRRVLLVTFNACDNLPTRPDARPDFLCSRDHRPLTWA